MIRTNPDHAPAASSRAPIFASTESRVQSYARDIPALFARAQGSWMEDVEGRRYLDFLSGAGSLNYGHNHPALRAALVRYVEGDGIAHSLDLHSEAKRGFLEGLRSIVLEPRALDYRVQFTGPTGSNAVEAALKLARKVTGRELVIAFTNGFHGVSLGALAATGNALHREAAGVTLAGIARMPFEGYLEGLDSLAYLEKCLDDRSSGIDRPAAVIVETVQGEGGLNAASPEWLRGLQSACRRREILLIVDDIQAGCGRTGGFFSFEAAALAPDLVVLSKSLSGYGLPLSVLLIRPELDVWSPGEHNGTFRGSNHAFVTATAALEHFWRDDTFASGVERKAGTLRRRLDSIVARHPGLQRKGRGLMQGIEMPSGISARAVATHAYRDGLVIETSGPDGEVVKCLCALTIEASDLADGLDILESAVERALSDEPRTRQPEAAD